MNVYIERKRNTFGHAIYFEVERDDSGREIKRPIKNVGTLDSLLNRGIPVITQ